jgi:hypothetical protein
VSAQAKAALFAGLLLAASPAWAATFSAAPLPDPRIPGFRFPERESTIVNWVYELGRGDPAAEAPAAFESMQQHGWGLWTALTLETSQVYEGHRLRVFETWYTPDELVGRSDPSAIAATGRRRASLRQFEQLHRGDPGRRDPPPPAAAPSAEAQFGALNGLPLPPGFDPADAAAGLPGQDALPSEAPAARPAAGRPSPVPGSETDRVIGFVKIDPTAAAHIARQGLLSTRSLDRLLRGGAQQVPPFPPTALTVKAVFQVITRQKLVGQRYYPLKVWRGPPDTPRPWGPSKWPAGVWIDTLDGGNGRGAVDGSGSTDGSTRTDDTTYPVSGMINFRLDDAEAAALNLDHPGMGAAGGDYAVLVAMHVAGREIARWTWQTFWWTPTPDDPFLPSSASIAGLRPAQLQGAPRNYAMALAYDMVIPGQPNTGGENAGLPVYAYNPWLESGFVPGDLPDSLPGLDPAGRPSANNYGFQSNCMSCHMRANYNPSRLPAAPRYSGARYVDPGDPQFAGTLQLDFLWSLTDHAQ